MRTRGTGRPGDPVAVLQRVYPPLLVAAASLVGPQEATDLVQEALVRVLARHPEFAGVEHPLGYSKAVLLHLAYRSWARPEVPADVLALLDRPAQARFDDPLIASTFARDAVRRLPPRQRACVYLKVIEDMGDTQIAAVLGCAESTVRSQAARGLATLARTMRAEEVADARS